VAQLFSLGHKRPFWFLIAWLAKGFGGSILEFVSFGF
jgi:hypothetical protein